MRKTTKQAQKAIERFNQTLAHFGNIDSEWHKGYMEAVFAITMQTLMDERCYYGFGYIDSKGDLLYPIYNEDRTYVPEYRDYRVRFYTK